MGFSIIAKTGFQKSPAITRGTNFTSIRLNSSAGQCFNAGCIDAYSPPQGKIAKVKGVFTAKAFNSNTFIVLNQFDNVTGFNIVVAKLSVSSVGVNGGSIAFETEIDSDQDFNVRGSTDAGTAATGGCVMSIEELPV